MPVEICAIGNGNLFNDIKKNSYYIGFLVLCYINTLFNEIYYLIFTR